MSCFQGRAARHSTVTNRFRRGFEALLLGSAVATSGALLAGPASPAGDSPLGPAVADAASNQAPPADGAGVPPSTPQQGSPLPDAPGAAVPAEKKPAPSTDIAATAVIPAPVDEPPLLPVPAVFDRAAPRSVDDLRAMEIHVAALISRVKPAAVALRVGRAHGAGVVISPEGLVLTAGHVVGRPGQRVEVIFPDGERAVGVSLGRDRAIDSGLVKLPEGRAWPHVPVLPEKAAKPSVGDWCLGLGHPGGFEASRPVVARLGRLIAVRKRFIQSDCELVGGDSGGPLFDMHGRVIAIHSRIGEATYFNFHVPSGMFHAEWDRLLAGEDFASHSGAYLGLVGDPVDGKLKVSQVLPGEAAERAGVQVGDLIVLFESDRDSKRISNLDQLIEIVGHEFPGDVVTLVVERDGKTLRLRAELGMKPD